MASSVAPEILTILADPASTLAQIQRALTEGEKGAGASIKLGVSSNVILGTLGIFLRRYALLGGVRLDVHIGNYDDPVGDMERFAAEGVEQVVILPFFDNLMPSFEAQLTAQKPEETEAKEAEFRSRYRLAFEKAKQFRHVFLCDLHRIGTVNTEHDIVTDGLARFNAALQQEAKDFANIRMIDMQGLVATVGHASAIDTRFYFRSKTPYTPVLLDKLALQVSQMNRGFGSYFYKALVVDCDNTLWGGIIGEDLMHGIKLDPYDYPGNVFWRAQQEFKGLERSGILLCLCSKNNPQDVDEVFRTHPNTVLRDKNIVLKKVNWQDKVQNLREIAGELNIGLDSLMFLDDSQFECTSVRQQLPMVRTFMVPKALSEYPGVIEEIKTLFLAGGIAADSRSKTEQYRHKAETETLRGQFASQEEYLASLSLKVELSRNLRSSIPRISELTLKSNQFNLTTHRYSEAEILALMDDSNADVYSMVVSDKLGNAGLTGVAVMRYNGAEAVIEAFLMSCRVIGRGVEFAVWDAIVQNAIQKGCTQLSAEFLPTAKNAQVTDYYDRLGLPLVSEADGKRQYRIALSGFQPHKNQWIEMMYA